MIGVAASNHELFALLVVLLLASDVVLPIPSSLVGTSAGLVLGLWPGAIISWAGLTLSCLTGYGLGRALAAPTIAKLMSAAEIGRANNMFVLRGPVALLASRSIPVAAEASVVAAGAMGMPLGIFLRTDSPCQYSGRLLLRCDRRSLVDQYRAGRDHSDLCPRTPVVRLENAALALNTSLQSMNSAAPSRLAASDLFARNADLHPMSLPMADSPFDLFRRILTN